MFTAITGKNAFGSVFSSPPDPRVRARTTILFALDATGVKGSRTNPERPFYHGWDRRETAIWIFSHLIYPCGARQLCRKGTRARDQPPDKLCLFPDFFRSCLAHPLAQGCSTCGLVRVPLLVLLRYNGLFPSLFLVFWSLPNLKIQSESGVRGPSSDDLTPLAWPVIEF